MVKPKRFLFSKLQLTFILCSLFFWQFSQLSQADVLQGSVEQNEANTRLSRPNINKENPQTGSLRLSRPSDSPLNGGLVDSNKFSNAQNGNLQSDTPSLGLIRPDEFKNLSAQKFDVGADRGSRELTIAWERWYKQLSGAIYGRWSRVADIPGHSIVRITVTKDRSLSAVMVRSSGNREFDRGLINAILSLDGNPGLTFPAQSERENVSLESDYIAGTNIDPGYSWIRNDVEKVNESY